MKKIGNFIKGICRKIMRAAGFSIARSCNSLELNSALTRKQAFLKGVKSVIDIGASDGRWTESVQKFFPHAHFLLIDGNQKHQAALEKFALRNSQVNFQICVAGENDGDVYFDSRDLFGGIASDNPIEGAHKCQSHTLEWLIKTHALKPPFVIKLDTHGFETEIISGLGDFINQTRGFIIESYNFRLSKTSLKLGEMIAFMEERGFFCVDLSEPLFRPKDQVFWQVDLFFFRDVLGTCGINSYE